MSTINDNELILLYVFLEQYTLSGNYPNMNEKLLTGM